uniref:Uncharacterized protein n=1 Tax=Strombidium inclinatum TaxID=197538 RepID=A0A7S3IG60_9SPIT|mmetsp:Transcript_14664/g.22726  ORF Transcript_14664/g.22726 Transcript_14664/m.22726 type:complete len:104 (+) Transcript_14664:35-346(+)
MKVWSTIALLLGAANAAESTEAAEPTEAVDASEAVDPYYYNYHYCTKSSQCYGTSRCGHYSYWTRNGNGYLQNHYDFKTCVASTTCGHYIKRGGSNVYVFCYF